MYITGASVESGAPFIVPFEFLGGTPPLSNELMGGYVFTVAVSFAVNLAQPLSGATPQAHCETNPASTFTVTIYKITGGVSTSIGTMVISTAGAFTFTVAVAPSFAVGDSIKFAAPSGVDGSLANLWWSLLGVTA